MRHKLNRLLIALSLMAISACAAARTWNIGSPNASDIKAELSAEGTLIISGKGNMEEPSFFESPWYQRRKIITNVIIEDGITSIPDYAFDDCTSLKKITIGNSIINIGEYAFRDCIALESITIPDSVKSIGEYAFSGCIGLTEIIIPENVTSIEDFAFGDCANLKKITFLGDKPKNISDDAFFSDMLKVRLTLYHPCGNATWDGYTYEDVDIECWRMAVFDISATADDNVTATLVDKNLTISGKGNMKNWTSINVPWTADHHSGITKVVIEDGITNIGDNAFRNFTNLVSITIPKSVNNIGYGAFSGCVGLKKVTFIGDQPNIGTDIFSDIPNDQLTLYYPCGNTTWDGYTYKGMNIVCWQWIVTLDTGDGSSEIIRQMVADSAIMTQLADLTRTGYTFTGWYNGDVKFDLTTPITSDITLTAGWTINRYTVTLYSDRGWEVSPEYVYVDHNTTLSEPDIPTKPGHSLIGWYVYDAPFFETKWDFKTNIVTNDVILCARWRPEWEIGYPNASDVTASLVEGTLTIRGNGDMSYDKPWRNESENIKNIIIEDGVTNIGDKAFYDYNNLTKVIIGDSVTTIGDNAFDNCIGLKEIIIGRSVKTIGSLAFYDCFSLKGINVSEDNAYYCSEGGVLFNEDKTILIQYPIGRSNTAYTIPDGVTSIEKYAFYGCIGLKEIIIPEGVTHIGDNAFESCMSLKKIIIPNSVTTIGDYVFDECTNLKEITIGKGVTTIGSLSDNCRSLAEINVSEDNAYYCSEDGVLFNKDKTELLQYPMGRSAKRYTIPNGVTNIGFRMFSGCVNLTEIIIPRSVTSIGGYAFVGCTNLKKITIPDGVKSIGFDTFRRCANLKEITIPNSVTSIASEAFSGCVSLKTITIPNSVEKIGDDAFYDCSSLTEINVSKDNAYYCSKDGVLFNKNKTVLLQYPIGRSNTAYTIPDGVTSIERHAFHTCERLTEVTIPNSVKHIKNDVFSYCMGLKKIIFLGNKPNIGDIFYKVPTNQLTWYHPCEDTTWEGYYYGKATITCRSKAVTFDTAKKSSEVQTKTGNKNDTITYPKGALVWKIGYPNASDIIATLVDSTLTIRGSGNMMSWESSFDVPWKNERNSIANLIIKNGITGIGNCALWHFRNLKKLNIPNSVKRINGENYAFVGCISLTEINVSKYNAYYYSKDGVLFNKDKTELLKYPIGKSDTTYTIPNSVTSIKDSAFDGCINLKKLTIPNSVTSIGNWAFSGCIGLSEVIISDGVTRIGHFAFNGCVGLTKITIPNSVVNIHRDAFEGCRNLREITFLGDKPNLPGRPSQ